MNITSHKSMLAASIIGLASSTIQAQTQRQMEELLLPKFSPMCNNQTKLIFPKGSNWGSLLKEFLTCSVPLAITVLPDNTLKMDDGNSIWIGEFKTNGSIEKIKDIK